MKKRTMIALIVAAALIVTGGVILMLGLSFAGGDRTDVSESDLLEQKNIIPETFDSIQIDTEDCNVTFAMFSGRDDALITVREHDRVSHNVLVEDGVLKITMLDSRKWYDKIGIFWEEMDMVVYLPEAQYASVRVQTATGDIEIPKEFSFTEVQLCSDTGEIDFTAAVAQSLSASTDTGDLEIWGSSPETMKLESDTGDISLEAAEGSGELQISTDTGSMEIENVTCRILTCNSATGDIELERVIAEAYLQALNDTGDVTVTDSDAGTVNIETATGDVTGNFLSPKWFQAHSDTGDVKVPNTREGGECRIESNTGSIRFR